MATSSKKKKTGKTGEMNEGLFELRKDESQMIWNNSSSSPEQATINNELSALCEADLGIMSAKNEAYFLETLKGLEDVTLVVEGRQLRMNRAILAHHSPVFHAMFYSDFKEKGETSVPLPGEKYADMVTFFKVLLPRDPSSEELISDENLLQLLVRADKYDTKEVKSRCQDYIGKQLMVYFRDLSDNRPKSVPTPTYVNSQSQMQIQKPDVINKLSLYLRACDDYDLRNYAQKLKSLIVGMCRGMTDLSSSEHYAFFSLILKVELLESMCRTYIH
ncbi:hypothetical protein ACOMHN_017271 [Nucella lapillus]